MAVDERSRKALYETLETTLGSGPADTMMALLPPVGWADVATKQDLEQGFENVRVEARATKQEVINTMTWRVFAMIAAQLIAVAALVLPLYS